MRVLMVDDDHAASRGLAVLLEEAGMVTDGVDTGGEALDLVRRNHYDLIVLDLTLPDVDGCELIRRMRLARIDVPVLVLSGLSRAEVRVQALGAGADDFMVKPFDRGELIARVQAAVRRHKARRQAVVRVGSVGLNLETLLSHLYGEMDEPESKIIDVFVCKLRRKLALAGAPDFVGTVWGLGYTVRDPRHADVMETSLAGEVRRPVMYDA